MASSPATRISIPKRACSSTSACTTPRHEFALRFYVYEYRLHDLIERYQTDTDFFFFRNRGRARLRGVEAELQSTLGRGVTLESAFQITSGRALDDDTYLDDISPETFSVQLRKWFAVRNAFAQLRAAHYAEDSRPGPTEREVPGYTLVDAGAGFSVIPGFELRVAARNLLNHQYMASQDVRTVAAPGRSVSVTAALRIGGLSAGPAAISLGAGVFRAKRRPLMLR